MKPIAFALICLAAVLLFYFELKPPKQKDDFYINAKEYYINQLNQPQQPIQKVTITHELKIEYYPERNDYGAFKR